LALAGISSKAVNFGEPQNKRKYNDGTELNDIWDLHFYETPCRTYDPQIGRFLQPDPLADYFESDNVYCYGLNNPIYYNDPLGLNGTPPDFANAADLIDYVLFNGVDNFSAGFNQWVFGDNGDIKSSIHTNNISIGEKNGVSGLWVSFAGGGLGDMPTINSLFIVSSIIDWNDFFDFLTNKETQDYNNWIGLEIGFIQTAVYYGRRFDAGTLMTDYTRLGFDAGRLHFNKWYAGIGKGLGILGGALSLVPAITDFVRSPTTKNVLKAGGSTFMLGYAIFGSNPLVGLIYTIADLTGLNDKIYQGAAWVYDNAVKPAFIWAGNKVSQAVGWVGDKVSDAADWAGDALSDAWDFLTDW
jgi:RHS repeat-associated protein